MAWSNSLVKNGFRSFYSGWSDYLPGYLYILWALGKVNITPEFQTILFKLPAIFADLATGYLIYKIVGKKHGLLASIFYIFNPAIFANSTLWGQADSLTALFSLLSVYLMPSAYSAIALAIGTLIKPQAAFVLPAILYLMFVHKIGFKKFLAFGFLAFTTFVAGFIPFDNTDNLFNFIFTRLSISANQYPYGSVNAFSFWGLFGFWKSDLNFWWIGLGVSIILITLITLIILKKKIQNGGYLISSVSLLITFLFMTRMHERHSLPVLAPLLVSAFTNHLLFIPYLLLSLTYVANLTYAYQWITYNYKEIFNPVLIKGFILLNITSLVIYLVSFFKKIILNFKPKFQKISQNMNFSTKDISIKKANVFLVLILAFSFTVRVLNLSKPDVMYFDEIYHAFTARLVLHNDPKAWEWWNPHPEGFAYEWTHPPLSKLGMALGMRIFGDNPFGWRVPQAILGTFSILLIYLLVRKIFDDKLTAILSAFTFGLEGLPLVLSRMGMNDVYVLFFSLLAIYLFIKDKNLFSSIAFGLAIASKWSAIYTLPIIVLAHFVFKKKVKLSYLVFFILPIIIYISSYGLMFKTGHSWGQFIEVQKQMWWYHTNLDAEHPYTSPAWSWPLNLRPVYLYDGNIVDNRAARIYAFGNPIVLWFGLFSIIMSIILSYKEKIKKLGFIVFCYLIFFLPWIASPRIMFFYHYLPSIPFLAIASGFILRRFPKLTAYYLLLTTILFMYFFPHWVGARIPIKLDESYYWLSSWR